MQKTVTVAASAPGIFFVSNPPAGAITGRHYNLIGPTYPLPRGRAMVTFATGLGAVTQCGQLSVASSPVTVVLNGTEPSTACAWLAPWFIGLYQVNVLIPASTPAGLGIPLTVNVAGQTSKTLVVSLQ